MTVCAVQYHWVWKNTDWCGASRSSGAPAKYLRPKAVEGTLLSTGASVAS